MSHWIIPCDIKQYDVIKAFNNHEMIDWKQSTNINVGDIVYIYVGLPYSRIFYICNVIENNKSVNTINDEDCILDSKNYANSSRFMTLKFINDISKKDIGLNFFKLNDFKVSVQGPSKFKDDDLKVLLDAINSDDIYYIQNLPRITNLKEVEKIIENEMIREQKDTESMMPFWRYLLEQENYISNATVLASIYGKNVGTLNLVIKRFGERVVKLLNIEEQSGRNEGKRYNNISFQIKSIGKNYSYILRDEFVEVLRRLVLVDDAVERKISIKKKEQLEIVNWNEFEVRVKKTNNIKTIHKKKDYVSLLKNQMINGSKGEKLVLEFEQNRLRKLGREDLADQVFHYADTTDSYGYDIRSFDLVEDAFEEIHIEVKTSSIGYARMNFFISSYELEQYLNDDKYRIYYIVFIGGKPKVKIIKPNDLELNQFKPTQYEVDLNILQKDIED